LELVVAKSRLDAPIAAEAAALAASYRRPAPFAVDLMVLLTFSSCGREQEEEEEEEDTDTVRRVLAS
jgi:hypothetical protein